MSSYITFKKILGEINMYNIDMIEQIIYWLTIFDDKKIIKRKIEQNYKDKINDSQVLQLSFVQENDSLKIISLKTINLEE